jgi:hypothetical protein
MQAQVISLWDAQGRADFAIAWKLSGYSKEAAADTIVSKNGVCELP